MGIVVRASALVITLIFSLSLPASAYYNPRQGRWMSRDPAGESGAQNLYKFVHNGPLSVVDVLGLEDVSIVMGPDIAKVLDEKLGTMLGTANALWGKGAMQQIINAAMEEFLADKSANPKGTPCKLDVKWIVSSFSAPLTQQALVAALSSLTPAKPCLLTSHGIMLSGSTETKIPLVTQVLTQPDPSKGILGGSAKGQLYSLVDILNQVGAEEKALNAVHVACCNAEWLPTQGGKTRVIRVPSVKNQGGPVDLFGLHNELKAFFRALCCKSVSP